MEKRAAKKVNQSTLIIIIIIALIAIAFIIIFLVSDYYKNLERDLETDNNINQAVVRNEKIVSIIFSENLNLNNIAKIKFIFSDKNNNEYMYSTLNIASAYEINASEINLINFKKVVGVTASFEYSVVSVSQCLELSQANSINYLTKNERCVSIKAENVTLDCDGYIISNNGIFDGVYSNYRYTTIKNCEINDTKNGISLSSSNNNTLTNITSNNNNNYGIHFESSNNNALTNVVSNNNNDGIYLYSSNDNTLTKTTANNNAVHGIYLYKSSNNALTNINANDNHYYGIRLYKSSDNTLTKTTANNNNYGIHLSSSNNNFLTKTTANDNRGGVYLFDSSFNNILNNELCYNDDKDVSCSSDQIFSNNTCSGSCRSMPCTYPCPGTIPNLNPFAKIWEFIKRIFGFFF